MMIDPITAFFSSLLIGFFIGYLTGRSYSGKKFYKYPSTAWRIRGR